MNLLNDSIDNKPHQSSSNKSKNIHLQFKTELKLRKHKLEEKNENISLLNGNKKIFCYCL